jgi:hypothetical protein
MVWGADLLVQMGGWREFAGGIRVVRDLGRTLHPAHAQRMSVWLFWLKCKIYVISTQIEGREGIERAGPFTPPFWREVSSGEGISPCLGPQSGLAQTSKK